MQETFLKNGRQYRSHPVFVTHEIQFSRNYGIYGMKGIPAELAVHVVLGDAKGVGHVAEGQTSVRLQQLENKTEWFSRDKTRVPDPYNFGPPGSGSFHKQATKFRKTWFLSLKTDVNVPTKSNNQCKLEKKLIFCRHLFKVTDEKGRIRISNQVYGSKDPGP